jgi:hypothetical protein
MDADELEEALALAILCYGMDGKLTIPKAVIDTYGGKSFELVQHVDLKKEEVTFRIIFMD